MLFGDTSLTTTHHRKLLRISPVLPTSELVDEAYSAFGVLHSKTTQSYADNELLTTGVVCSSWPSWAVPLSHSKFTLKWIILVSKHHVSFIRRCFPSVLVLLQDTVDYSCLSPVDVIGINGPLEVGLSPPSFGSIVLFDWNFRGKKWDDWYSIPCPLTHVECGGVSDFKGTFQVFVHSCNRTSFASADRLIGNYPRADLGAILDCRIHGTEVTQAPRLARLNPPVVSRIGNFFHPNGLFPLAVSNPEFLTRCVFVPSKWVHRHLGPAELLSVFDVPALIQKSLSTREQRSLGSFLRAPLKCYTALISGLLVDPRVSLFEGGLVESSRTFSSPLPTAHLPEPLPDGVPDSVSSWVANIKHDRDERAAKSDNAEVPIHFWNDSLAKKLGQKVLTPMQASALDRLREFFVHRIWVGSITKCFCKYLRCKHCNLLRMDSMFKKSPSRPSSPFCSSCHKYKKSTSKLQSVILNKARNKFNWSANGVNQYKKWWNIYRQTANHKCRREIDKDIIAGLDCISRARDCTVWQWKRGSRLFFWRWGEFQHDAHYGAKVFVQGKLPQCKDRQKAPKAVETLKLVQEKLTDVRRKDYISKGETKSNTAFFDVPKGEDDIRMVYNATSSGLNDAVWAPWFALPTVESHLRAVDAGTYMGDCDLGEMFLNFMLDVNIVPYAGVDLSNIFPEELPSDGTRQLIERWIRLLMGFRPSPYLTTRDMRRIEPILIGEKDDPKNVYRWNIVILNLPGSKDYDPSKPKVYRVRKDGTMAADLFIYIDDLRNTGPTEEECWGGAHQVCCRLTWFGLQDAPRKRNFATQTPRAWSGSIVHSDGGNVTVLVSEQKWEKTKKWIAWVLEHVEDDLGLRHNELERCRGFLIYVSRTYISFKPYLRGLHKTIEIWRGNKDEDG